MSFFGNLSTLFTTQKQAGKAGAPKSSHAAPKHNPKAQPAQPTQSAHPTQSAQQTVLQPQPQAQPKPVIAPQVYEDAQTIIRDAQAKAREIVVEAKDQSYALRAKTEQEIRELNRQIEEQQRELNRKLDRIDIKLTQLDERDTQLDTTKAQLEEQKGQLELTKTKLLERLEEISGMTKEEAKDTLLDGVEKKVTQQLAQVIRQKEEEARKDADDTAREILVDAMKHGATDYVSEYTISTVEIPSEEIKGKIIGKSGRNIHAFERITGVDIDLDTSPTEVRLSCFDPVRREIARISLERLIKDGRIQPTRIEEVVAKVSTEIGKIMFEAGKQLCQDLGVYNLPPDLIQMIGRFKFRFSYGQNLIAHTLEETRIGIKIAHELGADVNVVKLGCLLHDIGKVAEDAEGSHVELGIKIAKKFGISQPVIDCIAQHHEDEPFTGPEQMIVYIADAISGARPGARYENYDAYVKRLENLEEIANSYESVKQSYAIQAGREVRVLLDPERSKDDDVEVVALKIRDRIKNEMTYPGTVTVTVIREKRGRQIAT